jgi:hypothetical protein
MRLMTGSASRSIGPNTDCFIAELIIGPAEGGTRWFLAMATVHDFRLSPVGALWMSAMLP